MLPEELRSILYPNKSLIEIIRHYNTWEKTELSSRSGLSWPTVRHQIDKLLDKKIVIARDDKNKGKGSPKYILERNCAYFAGIAVGCKQIKFIIVDFRFKCVKFQDIRNCEQAKDNSREKFDKLRTLINEEDESDHCLFFTSLDSIVRIAACVDSILDFLKSLREDGVPICGIGLSVPGAVDFEEQRIVGALNKPCLNNLRIDDFLYEDKREYFSKNGILVTMDHHAKLTAVAEKEYLYLNGKKNSFCKDMMGKGNIATVYMGTGIAVGLILEHKLYRGASNFSGEIGHLSAPEVIMDGVEIKKKRDWEDVYCRCSKTDCLELRFKEYGLYDVINEKKDLDDTSKVALEFYIRYIIEILSLFNPSLIIFSGKIADIDSDIWNSINLTKRERLLPYVADGLNVMKSLITAPHSAIGAAINSYYAFLESGSGKDSNEAQEYSGATIEWLNVPDETN